MSYLAGWPVPSFTSVKDSVTELSVTLATARSVTVPGLLTGAVTVTTAAPLFPSLVAVIVAVPAPTPLTSPLPLTVATDALLVVHVTTRPPSGVPLASFGVAVSCAVAPTGTLAVAGLSATDATGTALIVIAAEPPFPSLVAVIVPVPPATPLTSPLPLTVATAPLLVAQLIVRPLNGRPLEANAVPLSCPLAPPFRLAVARLI